MSSDELIYELRDAVMTIRELRRQNELLSARVETMELLGRFLNAEVRRQSVGAAPDIAWTLERRIQQIEDSVSAQQKAANEMGDEITPTAELMGDTLKPPVGLDRSP